MDVPSSGWWLPVSHPGDREGSAEREAVEELEARRHVCRELMGVMTLVLTSAQGRRVAGDVFVLSGLSASRRRLAVEDAGSGRSRAGTAPRPSSGAPGTSSRSRWKVCCWASAEPNGKHGAQRGEGNGPVETAVGSSHSLSP